MRVRAPTRARSQVRLAAGRDRRHEGARDRRRSGTRPGQHEVVVFTLGKTHYAVARAAVLAIRPSPRLRSAMVGVGLSSSLPLVSLSSVIGLERDTSVDRRVLEVLHWGQQLGIEVTSVTGIRQLDVSRMHVLPALLRGALGSRAVLGLARWDDVRAVVLDLPLLLVERGVEVPALP